MTPQEAAALYMWVRDSGLRPPDDRATATLCRGALTSLIEAAGGELTWVLVDDRGPEQIVDLTRWQP